MIDDQEFDSVSQNAHMLCGALAVLGPAALAGPHAYMAHWIGAAVVMVWAGVKEFWWDERYETAEVRGSNLRDFSFYGIGTLLALCLYAILIAL